MFVAWLKPPWQQITPYIADRRFCAPKMKRNGAKKGRKGGRVKVEKKMTMKKGTKKGGEGRGCAEELEGCEGGEEGRRGGDGSGRKAPCGAESRSNLFHFQVLQRRPVRRLTFVRLAP